MNQTAGEQSIPGLRGAVLVVDEDIEYLDFVRSVVQGVGCGIWACNSYVEGIRQLGSARFVAIVVGQGGPHFEGRCVLERAAELDRHLPVIVVARILDMECYMEAMQLGAVDYIAGPDGAAEIARVVKNYAPSCKRHAATPRQSPNAPSRRFRASEQSV